MKKSLFKSSGLALLLLAITLTSCDKEVETPEAPTATTPTVTTPKAATPDQFGNSAGDAYGVLVAVKSVTSTEVSGFPIDVKLGLGVAYFTETKGDFSSFTGAGKVTLNSEELVIQDNKSYVYSPTNDQPTGIDISSSAAWSVAGAGGTSALNLNYNSFPTAPKITSEKTIKKSDGYTLAFTTSVADSVICSIYSGSITVQQGKKPISGSNTVKFTADDLKDFTVGETGASIQIAVINLNSDTTSGKKYILINESVVTALAKVE